MSGQKILQAVRRISLVAVLSGAVAATAFPAAALPPGGASADTPGTSTSVSPRTVEQCGTLNWNVAGFPAGETVHIKIDDGDGTDQATHGAGVVQTQRIGSGGTASGSLQIPCNMAPGGHWLRYLATGGENNLGYTARAGSDFTVVARAGGNAGTGAAGQRPQSQAGGAGQNQPARNNQAGAAQANRNQPTRNQGQAPARGQGQPAARNQGAGAAAPARSGGNAGAGGAAAGGGGTGSTAAGNTGAAGNSGGGGGAGRAAGAAAPAGTHTGGGAAAGAAGAGAIGIDGAFLAQDAGTGTAGVFDKNADDPSQPSAISQAAAQQASGARAPVIGLFVGGAILLVGLTAINVWVLLQLRRDRREEQYQRPTQYFHGG
ncbi:hypothetical protein [Corynebacterium propinquum]|uniref:hypothetical protein n=1 Tax=Corynebacterium propinquum TaxID=43769 RepID=UPI00164ED92C|nr:hypothetical protein [Corynebacterium propinquum]MDK4239773.1 hypothetical protein [Corynebacterium propinquum]MDK8665977.1 hypothetical protein [Corynebacterium propinquum]QQU86027.1 hypothetical protein I6I70_10210 [Corynebacterium propinquum]UQV60534.1 hypothetical protein L9H28_01315 [Corynebacterium propinquum]WKS27670.1 hypothetical protein NLL49_10960 [Corynebacterium propinquum]